MRKTIFIIKMALKMIISPFNDFERMEKFALTQVQKDPSFYLPKLYLASLYKDNNMFEKSSKYYKEALETKQTTRNIFEYAKVLYKIGDFRSAIEQMDKISNVFSNDMDFRKIYAFCLMEEGRFEEAGSYLFNVIEEDQQKEDFKVVESIGYCLLKLGKYEESSKYYEKAIELKPESAELKNIYDKITSLTGLRSETK